MLKFLIKKFIKDPDNVSSPSVRTAYGTLCGIYGVFWNVLLFLLKLLAGIFTGSVAITADAFNNLSDAGSSVITLVGFHLASKNPDSKHPYGHGRIEYIAALAISMIIVIIGYELGRSSVLKIKAPEPITFSFISVFILLLSIFVKLYIASYNRMLAKKINSTAMEATAVDSTSDCISTAVVLISMFVSYFTGVSIDGWAGLIIAVFIIVAGIQTALKTISPMLGEAPDHELVDGIRQTVLSHKEVLDIHDLLIHNYGPGKYMVSLHTVVDGNNNLFSIHSVIDNIEEEIKEKYNCLTTIHLDPIDPNDKELDELRNKITDELRAEFNIDIKIHDFRLEKVTDGDKFFFDIVIPPTIHQNDDAIYEKIFSIVSAHHPGCSARVTIDRSEI